MRQCQIAFLAVFCCTAGSVLGQEQVAKSKIVSAGVFKNGLTFIKSEVTVPGAGTFRFDSSLEPVHGTFWIESNCKVESAVKMREVDVARQLGAQALLLVTAVNRVMLDYGTPSQSSLSRISADQAARYLAEGQFPPGSMGPKIESALRFLDDGGELAVITSPALLAATLTGHGETAGTRIERAASQSGQAR